MGLINRGPAIFVTAVLIATLPAPALAYGGPGLGLGILSAVLGVLGAFLLGFATIVSYPFRRLIRRIRRFRPPAVPQPERSDSDLEP